MLVPEIFATIALVCGLSNGTITPRIYECRQRILKCIDARHDRPYYEFDACFRMEMK